VERYAAARRSLRRKIEDVYAVSRPGEFIDQPRQFAFVVREVCDDQDAFSVFRLAVLGAELKPVEVLKLYGVKFEIR
jgi:hypothetical protein